MRRVLIESTVQKPTREHGLAYYQREILEWNFNLETGNFQPIIRESAFHKIEVDEYDDSGEPTGNKITTKKVVEIYPLIKSKPFKSSQVDGLFVAMQNSIEVTESFESELRILLNQALLLNTRSFDVLLYQILPEEWVISEN